MKALHRLMSFSGRNGSGERVEIRLIVQSDDMAAAHGTNEGIIKAYREGILRTTNVMVPSGWLPEAARLLRENPGLDVGVHLVLTSEWENFKWRPLTIAPTLVDSNGYFHPIVRPTPGFAPGTSLSEKRLDLGEVERELRAQIELAKKMIPHVTYVWEHMGFSSASRLILDIVRKLAREYRLVIPGPELGVQFLNRIYRKTDSGSVRAEKLAAQLAALGPGTWLLRDHAAADTSEIQALGCIGYDFVAADRSAVVQAWTSSDVIDVIKTREIKLTSYRELIREQSPDQGLGKVVESVRPR